MFYSVIFDFDFLCYLSSFSCSLVKLLNIKCKNEEIVIFSLNTPLWCILHKK